MNNLQIPKTKYTMEIDFNKDTGIFQMGGSSYPENAPEFFEPIVLWIKTYIDEVNQPVTMNIRLNYLNTSSTKCMLDIFEIFEQYHQSGGQVNIRWYYAKDDEDIMETGEELCEDFNFSIEFISL
ncbi:MAG: DUF1987 domain-containing protein [Candidatus Omnitrophota bacterium]